MRAHSTLPWMDNLSCSLGSIIMPSQMLTGALRNISTSASSSTALLQLAPHKGIWTDVSRLDMQYDAGTAEPSPHLQ